MRCFANRKFSGTTMSCDCEKTCPICNVIVSIKPSVCSANSRYGADVGPASGPSARTAWIFFRASTLREGSLLSMLEMTTVISSGAESKSSGGAYWGAAIGGADAGAGARCPFVTIGAGCARLLPARARGAARREAAGPGSRPMPDGPGMPPAGRDVVRTGELDRVLSMAIGALVMGELGRAKREAPAIAPGRGSPPPIRVRVEGDAGRADSAATRLTWARGA